MEISIFNFISVLVFSMPVGFGIYAFIKGKFPAKGSPMGRNYIVWGDKNVDPKLLTGNRSRLLASAFIVLFGLFTWAMFSQNDLLGTILISNLVSVFIGLIIGIFLCRKMISY